MLVSMFFPHGSPLFQDLHSLASKHASHCQILEGNYYCFKKKTDIPVRRGHPREVTQVIFPVSGIFSWYKNNRKMTEGK